MKLSCECVRDILLCLEGFDFFVQNEYGDVDQNMVSIDDLRESLPQYTAPELLYTLLRLEEGDYITASKKYADDILQYFFVTGMTYEGHEFLERIRPATTWKKVLPLLQKLGSFSLNLLSSVSGSILTAEASRWIAGG